MVYFSLEEKPRIVNGLKPTEVQVGNPAIFEIEIAGGPVKQIKWYKNGKEFENPQTEQPDLTHYRLIIPNALIDDDGAEFKVIYLF